MTAWPPTWLGKNGYESTGYSTVYWCCGWLLVSHRGIVTTVTIDQELGIYLVQCDWGLTAGNKISLTIPPLYQKSVSFYHSPPTIPVYNEVQYYTYLAVSISWKTFLQTGIMTVGTRGEVVTISSQHSLVTLTFSKICPTHTP